MRTYKLRAVAWLHILRLWRYKLSFINSALTITLWILIFLLGALMFMPGEAMPEAIPTAFWGIAMWNIVSNVVGLISGWTWYYLSQGFVEEHMLADTSPFLVLAGRPITGLSMSLLTIIFTYVVTSPLSGSPFVAVADPLILVMGLLSIVLMSMAAGLILAALSFRVGVQQMFIEVMNLALLVVGGLATPISRLPEYLRPVAILVVFSYPAELVRLGAIGLSPWLPLDALMMLSLILTLSMLALALLAMRWIEARMRKHGLKAIGRM